MDQGRLTNIQAMSRPDDIWPEVWSNMSKNSQPQEKQGKPRLNAARQLRRLHNIDTEDQEFDVDMKTHENRT